MIRVLVWGLGKIYNQYVNLLKYYISVSEIDVVGVVANDVEGEFVIDGFHCYPKTELSMIKYDYCLVAISDFARIIQEADRIGIERRKLIPIRILSIPFFSFTRYLKLKEEGISIVSRNCWGGLAYNYLGLEFKSPTINLFFSDRDFNKLIKNYNYYINCPVSFVEKRWETILNREYPVGRIDDIIIHFNHYTCFDDAVESWEKRKKRMVSNILFVSSTDDIEVAKEFARLPVNNKIMFIPKGLKVDGECFCELDFNLEDDVSIGMCANKTATGENNRVDILKICTGEDYLRYHMM